MSDIQQLKNVITSLEEQGNELHSFVGLLSEVQAARIELSASEKKIDEVSSSLRIQLRAHGTKFERFKDKMIETESRLLLAEKTSADTLTAIKALCFVTPEQFVSEIEGINKAIKDSTAKLNTKMESIEDAIKGSTAELNTKMESIEDAIKGSTAELNTKMESIKKATRANRTAIIILGLINMTAVFVVIAAKF